MRDLQSREVRPHYPSHYEASARLTAPPAAVFAHLDDQTRLAAHMTKSSAMMGGGRMTYEFDAARGMAVGSRIRMGGSAFGLKLFVEEVVTERTPPRRKVWRTVGRPRLLIIDAYEMGFRVDPWGGASDLCVWIDYAPPRSFVGAVMAILFGGLYARWCVHSMLRDAKAAFALVQPSKRSPR